MEGISTLLDPTLSISRRRDESWPLSTCSQEVDDGEAPSKGVLPRSICTKIYVAWLVRGSRPVDAKHGQVRCSHSCTEYDALGGGLRACSAQSVGEDELNSREAPRKVGNAYPVRRLASSDDCLRPTSTARDLQHVRKVDRLDNNHTQQLQLPLEENTKPRHGLQQPLTSTARSVFCLST